MPPEPSGDSGHLAAVPQSLRANREFTLLWCGQAVSGLGSAASLLAYPLLILAISGSAVEAGAVGTATAFVRTVCRIPGGALADRWNRRTVLLACDSGRIVLLGVLAVLVVSHQGAVALALVCIRKPLQGTRDTQQPQSFVADVGQGLRLVRRSRLLRTLVLIFVFVDFAFPAAMFTVIVVLRQAGQPAGTIGLAQGVIGAGGVLGALAASWMQRRASFRGLVNLTVAVLCGCLALTAVLSGRLAMVLPLTAALFMAPALNAAIFAKLASTTPERLQGRVMSVILASTGLSVAVAPLVAGLLITHVGGWAALTACTASAGAALVVTATSSGLREA